jgi:CO dehydrogenase maturation factor
MHMMADPGNMGAWAPHHHDHFEAPVHKGHRIIAVCGKGGVGKTAFSAMLTSVCAESGQCGRVLAIDADPAMGLAMALDVDVEKTIGQVREEIIKTARLGEEAAESELVEHLDYLIMSTLVETDKFSLIAMGRSDGLGCYCSVNDLLRDVIAHLVGEFDTVIIDGEAGLEQINRQVVAGVDDLIILTDTSRRSLATVQQITDIAITEEIVPSTDSIGIVVVRPAEMDADFLARVASAGGELLGTVPYDENLAVLDSRGLSLAELPHDSEAYHSVWHIAEKILSRQHD